MKIRIAIAALSVLFVMFIPYMIQSMNRDASRYISKTAPERGSLPTDIRYQRYVSETADGTQGKKTHYPAYSMFPNKLLTPTNTGAYKKVDPMEMRLKKTLYPWLKTMATLDEMIVVLKRNPGAINARDDQGRNGLMISVDMGDIDRAKLMISYKIDVNALSIDEQRSTVLHMLARKSRLIWQDVEMLKILIKAGANVNTTDAMGRTPLHWIGGIGDPVIRTHFLDVLMSHGADINVQDNNGQTMIYTTINYLWRDTSRIYDATLKFDTWIGTLFKKYGSKIDGKLRDKKNYSPIDYARELGFMTVVQFLCTTGKWPCRADDKKGYNMPTGR